MSKIQQLVASDLLPKGRQVGSVGKFDRKFDLKDFTYVRHRRPDGFDVEENTITNTTCKTKSYLTSSNFE